MLPLHLEHRVAELHWFPFYALEWLASSAIGMMLPEQRGAYIQLLAFAWTDGDAEPSVLNDPATLAQQSGLGARWKKLGPLVLAQFEARDGRLYNAKLSEVWTAQQDKHAKAVAKAVLAVEAREEKKRLQAASSGESPSSPPSATSRSSRRSSPRSSSGSSLSSSSGSQNLEGTAPPVPYGTEEEHVPASGDALAPEGAALPAATNGTNTGTGDYLNRPSVRDELRKRTHVQPWVPGQASVPTIGDVEEARRERETAYRGLLTERANAWMDDNAEATKAIGFGERARLGFPVRGTLPDWQVSVLREAVVEVVRTRHDWPSLDGWDGADFLAGVRSA